LRGSKKSVTLGEIEDPEGDSNIDIKTYERDRKTLPIFVSFDFATKTF
jgi:hypothetical protein